MELFEARLKKETEKAEQTVLSYLPEAKGFEKTIHEAMNYSVGVGGKRLRPVIMYMMFNAFGGDNDEKVKPFMAALEMIHNYSLVHDDLPEMDNDELRRGNPTTHVKFGQAMAVLAGDALLNYAFETALKSKASAENIVEALGVLADKAGINGMIGGQVVDVESEKNGTRLTHEQLVYISANKTAALFQAAFMIGALLAGADKESVSVMEQIGYNLGVAFQLQDDVLDIVSTTEVLGKPVGSDEKNGKATYVSYLGMEETIKEQKRLSKEAVGLMEEITQKKNLEKESADFVVELIKYLVERKL